MEIVLFICALVLAFLVGLSVGLYRERKALEQWGETVDCYKSSSDRWWKIHEGLAAEIERLDKELSTRKPLQSKKKVVK